MKVWREKDKVLGTAIWRADFEYKKKRYRPKAFTKTDLAELITQIKSNADRKKVGLDSRAPKVSIDQLVSEHVKDFDLTIPYYRRALVVLGMFKKSVGKDTAVTEIGATELKAYVRFRRSQNPKLQNSSVNKDLTYISKMFSDAHSYFKELKDYKLSRMPWEAESTKTSQRTI